MRDMSIMKINISDLSMIAILLALFGIGAVAFGQQGAVTVESAIDRQQAYMGDRLRYTLTLTTDSNVVVDSIPIGESLGKFEIKKRSSSLSSGKLGKLTHNIEFVIAAYETGQLWIPRLTLRFIATDGSITEATTDSLSVVILSLASTDSLADIKGLKPPVYFGGRFPWIYVAIALIVLAGVLIWLWKSRRKAPDAVAEVNSVDRRPPWVIAEEELKKLRESDLLRDEEYKLFYLRLTEILKTYLEPRYGIDALDRTTTELRNELKAIGLDQADFDLLFELFVSADLVKFAKLLPSTHEAESDFQRGWRFVQDTSKRRSEEVDVK